MYPSSREPHPKRSILALRKFKIISGNLVVNGTPSNQGRLFTEKDKSDHK